MWSKKVGVENVGQSCEFCVVNKMLSFDFRELNQAKYWRYRSTQSYSLGTIPMPLETYGRIGLSSTGSEYSANFDFRYELNLSNSEFREFIDPTISPVVTFDILFRKLLNISIPR